MLKPIDRALSELDDLLVGSTLAVFFDWMLALVSVLPLVAAALASVDIMRSLLSFLWLFFLGKVGADVGSVLGGEVRALRMVFSL